jgi:hypothetical protein
MKVRATRGMTLLPEAEFFDEIQTKVLRVFLLAIHSHLYSFVLRFLFLQTLLNTDKTPERQHPAVAKLERKLGALGYQSDLSGKFIL